MLLLIDTHDQEPEPERPPRRRHIDWRLWMWTLESLGLFVIASSVAGAVAVVCAFVGVFAIFKVIEALGGDYVRGPGEWRR
ncbi:MAG: hypothetical protein WKF40_05580 [Thermoleophilaceae bacterium]|jgi:hypothetical protein